MKPLEEAPTITLRDPLADFLGASPGGLFTYSYADAVKLAGHSCPTVAGAWRAVCDALTQLYGTDIPVRGAVRVELQGAAHEGTVGVVAAIAGLITGAAGEGGFKGIAGQFVRRGLLVYGSPIHADLRLTRLDTGASVEANLPEAPPDDNIRNLLRAALAPGASAEHREAFARAWQQRVEHVLRADVVLSGQA